ncbi:cyclic nucleotide-binding domain-containing protein [Hydrogenophaga defluvii]|uniref:Cyclic nucleotide-binding domain-containing protein n=1 Tax=Hydrogenophaga defluvii TaxID=249410 RepID=A0ABW2S746_9BURK
MPAADTEVTPVRRRGVAGLSDELRLTLLLFLFSFFISGVPRVYTQTAAHALFIETYGAAALPWAYLAEALCVPLAGYLYLQAERHLVLGRLMVATLGSQIVALVAFHQGVGAGIPLVAGASIVYFEIEFVLSSLLLWGLANQLMTLRQGKRLFGFVSAGEPVAIIVCGLSTPWLLRWLSPADLFLLSAVGAAVGIWLVLHILRHHAPLVPSQEAQADAAVATGHPWWKDPYVRVLVVLVLVGQMAYFFVDNAFYVELDKRFPDEHAMASFLGLYSAVMGAVSLVCSVLLAPWLLRRFGVRGGLLTLPLLLLLGALATVLMGGLGGPADVLFWLVVGNKVIDQSFRYTLDKTTFVTLFQPLPARQRLRVQAGLEGMVEPLSGGLAGLLLFALIQGLGFGAVGITAVILAVTCVWAGLVAVQYRGYLSSLRTALAGRRVSVERLSLDDAQSRQLLRQGLRSARAGEVLYSLSLLDGIDEGLTDAEVTSLLQHTAPEVRRALASRIENGRTAVPPLLLRQALAAEADASVRSAWVQALAALGDDQWTEVAAWLDHPDDALALGARVGLIRHGGVEGVLLAGPHLLADQQSPDANRRRRAAQVMGLVGSVQFYRPLLVLIADADPAVAAAALQAAGVVAAPKLWPAMAEALGRPGLQRAAVAALARVGEDVLPALDALRQRPGLQVSTRLALVDVHRRMSGPAGDARLVVQLDDPSRAVSLRALRALWLRRHRLPPDLAEAHRGRVLDEVEHAVAALGAWRQLGSARSELAALRSVLAEDVALSVQTCFCWLGLITHSFDVHEALAHYEKGDPARRAYVIEMLDNTLPVALKRRLLDLLEPEGMAERAARLVPDVLPPSGAIAPLLWSLAAEPRLSPFARAAAAYLGAREGGPPAVVQVPQTDDSLMPDILAWVAKACPPLGERPAMLTIEKMLVLRSVSLFAGVREAFLVGVAASATEVHLRAGEVLFEEGELGTSLYVIASGELEVVVGGQRVALMGERDVVGEMAALDPEPRSAQVRATQDALLLRLTDQDLDLLMSEDAEVSRAIIQTLCRRLRNARASS